MKRKTLTTAVMAGLTGMAGMMSVANAVNVNPDGLGQVLLYPYYTARGGNDTLISVVNTTSAGKAVKIRFLEALNSREVLDFNIYLSPFDVWTAAITDFERSGIEDPDGGAFGLMTGDTTCTAPYIYDRDFNGNDPAEGDGVQRFVDFRFASEPFENPTGPDFAGTLDGGPTDIERTASGYIEIIEMGTMVAQPDPLDGAPDSGEDAIVPWNTKHVAGEPRDCGAIVDLWRAPAPGDSAGPGELGFWETVDPTFGFEDAPNAFSGGLFGSASIINVTEGLMFSYNATALDSFWAATTPVNHTSPGTIRPQLWDATATEANAFINGSISTTNWAAPGPFAVNAAITLDQLMNEFSINTGDLLGRTEWVLTFPTKARHVDTTPGSPNPSGLDNAIPPFTGLWTAEEPFSCDTQDFAFWDREEGPEAGPTQPGDPGDVIISPPPPPTPGTPPPTGFQLCREANVVRFSNEGTLPEETEIFGEPLRLDSAGEVDRLSYTNFGLPEGVISGWVQFDFSGFTSFAPANADGDVITGLPVIGFSANTFTNNDIGDGIRASFGGSFKHRGTRTIAQPASMPQP